VLAKDTISFVCDYVFNSVVAVIVGYVIMSLARDRRRLIAYILSFFKLKGATVGTQTEDIRLNKDTIYISPGGDTIHHKKDCQGWNTAMASAYPRMLCLHPAGRCR
jgi:hypothetical protein